MCYARPMLSLDDLFIAALTSAKTWQEQEAMLRGLGCDDAEVEAVRVALEQRDAEAVARIVAGPEPD
jgi:hypothetical protein